MDGVRKGRTDGRVEGGAEDKEIGFGDNEGRRRKNRSRIMDWRRGRIKDKKNSGGIVLFGGKKAREKQAERKDVTTEEVTSEERRTEKKIGYASWVYSSYID